MWKLFNAACLAALFCSPGVVAVPAFELINENEFSECSVSDDGLCIFSDANPNSEFYPQDARCTFSILRTVLLSVVHFDLGHEDRLRVANMPFKGTDGPDFFLAPAGKKIRFIVEEDSSTSTSSDFGFGFQICALGSPTIPQPGTGENIVGPRLVGDNAACLTQITSEGACLWSDTSEILDYPASFRCIWDVEEATTLWAHDFALGLHDRLRINNIPYKGVNGPNGVVANAGTQVRFIVEEQQGTPAGQDFDNGFKICTFPPP